MCKSYSIYKFPFQVLRKHAKYIKDQMENFCVRYRQNDNSAEVACMCSTRTTYAANIMAKELQFAKKVTSLFH